MGVKQLIVAFNKMDTHNYSQERFQECKEEATKLLTVVGYNIEKDVTLSLLVLITVITFPKRVNTSIGGMGLP